MKCEAPQPNPFSLQTSYFTLPKLSSASRLVILQFRFLCDITSAFPCSETEFKEVQTATCGEHNKGVSTSKKRKSKDETKHRERGGKNAQRVQLANHKSAYKRAERQTRCHRHTLNATSKEITRHNEVAAD
ncbi:hypothetical protein [Stieleria mannarensis]|uniref:hypothetical protein n=1 Tax=Stieleria mannarensis TaxID=2755585 RepID=UPI0015FF2AB0|nr:hypothetical protein [Rhodopirellula sp. JC639]